MTKKDFELIASVLNKYYTCETTKGNLLAKQGFFELIGDFADILASKNPRFQKEKFLQACGVEVAQKCIGHDYWYNYRIGGQCLRCGMIRKD